MLARLLLLTLILIGMDVAFAAEESVQTFALDGRLYSDALSIKPMLDSDVELKIQILNPSQTCIIYEESQHIATANTEGYFSIRVGSAATSIKRSAQDSGHSMSRVYSNTVLSLAGKAVTNGAACSYAPGSGDARYLRLQVIPSSDGVPRTLSPAMALDAVPTALVAERAETLQGLQPQHLVLVNTTAPAMLSQSNLENVFSNTNYPKLVNLLENGSGILSLVAGPGLTGGTISSGGKTIGIDVGTSANKIVQLDSGAKLPAVDASALTNLDASHITSGTLSSLRLPSIVVLDGGNWPSGNLQIGTSNAKSMTLMTNGISRLNLDASGYVGVGTSSPGAPLEVRGPIRLSGSTSGYTGFQPAAEAGTTVWTLPASDGAANQVLTTNGSGELSWSTATDSSRAPAAGSASITTVGTITSGTWNGGTIGVAYGGTGTTTGSITGTGSLTFAAGGSNQNVTMTPSGTGSTILNGKVGIGTVNPSAKLEIASGTSGQSGLKFTNINSSTATGTGATLGVDSSGNVITVPTGVLSQWTTTGTSIYYSTGKVGIGTTAPSGLLDVQGGTSTTGSGYAISLISQTGSLNGGDGGNIVLTGGNGGYNGGNGASVYITAGSGGYNYGNGGNIILSPGSQSRGTVGNVGIGTSAPGAKLEIASGTSGQSGLKFTNFNSSAAIGTGATLGVDSSGNVIRIATPVTQWTTSGSNIYYTSGSIGVGTAAPGAKLEVSSGTSGQSGLKFTNINSSTATGTGATLGVDSSGNVITVPTGVSSQWTTTGTSIYYSTGKVGIGTTAPSGLLDVQGGTSTTGSGYAISLISQTGSLNGGDGGNIVLTGGNGGYNGGNGASVYITAGSGGYNYGNGGNIILSPGSRIQSSSANGNVGIGTTAPGYKLDVAGDLRITGTPYRTGGDIAWQVPSDARLKNVTGPYEHGLDDLTKLDLIRFRYKENNPVGADTSKEYTGVLAQDVQKVIPEAVNEDPKTGFLSLNTTPIFWAVINAVKDLYRLFLSVEHRQANQDRRIANVESSKADKAAVDIKVLQLESENAAKEQKIKELEQRLEHLEKYLNEK